MSERRKKEERMKGYEGASKGGDRTGGTITACHRVFVYGTLRRGESNHYFISDPSTKLLSEQCWISGAFRLIDTGNAYPALEVVDKKEGEDGATTTKIFGELYLVTSEVLARLNHLEGYDESRKDGNLYDRITTHVNGDRFPVDKKALDAFVYVSSSFSNQNRGVVEGSDWRWHRFLERYNRSASSTNKRKRKKKEKEKGEEEEEEEDTFHYFAYGSCMDDGRFKEARVDNLFKPVGVARLDGYRLGFTRKSTDGGGRADIIEEEGEEGEGEEGRGGGGGRGSGVVGVVYRCPASALHYLMGREGAPLIYRPTFLRVSLVSHNNDLTNNPHNKREKEERSKKREKEKEVRNNNNKKKEKDNKKNREQQQHVKRKEGGGRVLEGVLSFVVRDKDLKKEYAPPVWYANEILRGAELRGLDAAYLQKLKHQMHFLGCRL